MKSKDLNLTMCVHRLDTMVLALSTLRLFSWKRKIYLNKRTDIFSKVGSLRKERLGDTCAKEPGAVTSVDAADKCYAYLCLATKLQLLSPSSLG